MKIKGVAGTENGRGLPLAAGLVSADNFVEKAIGFMRVSGRPNGEHPVVKKDIRPGAWRAWISYLRQIGTKVAFAESTGVMTVPALYPWDFSVDADGLRHLADRATVNERKAPIYSMAQQQGDGR